MDIATDLFPIECGRGEKTVDGGVVAMELQSHFLCHPREGAIPRLIYDVPLQRLHANIMPPALKKTKEKLGKDNQYGKCVNTLKTSTELTSVELWGTMA